MENMKELNVEEMAKVVGGQGSAGWDRLMEVLSKRNDPEWQMKIQEMMVKYNVTTISELKEKMSMEDMMSFFKNFNGVSAVKRA